MTTELRITFDANRKAGDLAAYRISMTDSDAALTDRLMQDGATENNRVHYRGVFASQGAAAEAAMDYIGRGCKLFGVTPWGSTEEMVVPASLDAKPRWPEATVRVIASRNATGTFLANAPR